ncbi:MAG: hypothetical protein KAR42_05700 [candidate division Zixibacteria bacterium]|nr:hypothetical protein [candidate division Zixibacteria bacterium]
MQRFVIILFLFSILFISAPVAQNLLSGPESVAWDSTYHRYLVSNWRTGRIVAVDTLGNHTVFTEGHSISMGNVIEGNILYSSCGTLVKGFDLATAEEVFTMPIIGTQQLDGMTADTSGYLYVMESRASVIFKINPADSTSSVLVQNDLPALAQDLFFDAAHNRILVASFAPNAPIIAIDPVTGDKTSLVITPFGNMDGITMDPFGNTYVTSYLSGEVYRYDSTFTNPPELISSGHTGPAGIDFNTTDFVLAVPSVDANTLDIVSDIGGLLLGNIEFNDAGFGNGNGVLEAGEIIEVTVEITNTSYYEITNTSISMSIDDQTVVVTNGEFGPGNLSPTQSASNSASPFTFQIPSVYTPRLDEFTFEITGNNGDIDEAITIDAKIGLPLILLIDDDNSDDIEQYYLECFNDFRVPCSVWAAPPAPGGIDPDSSDMNKFDIVIWFTGDDRLPFESYDLDAMAGYMDGGGNLFLTGQGMGAYIDLMQPSFLTDYLRCSRLSSGYLPMLTGAGGGVIGLEGDTIIIFGDGADNQTNPDHLAVTNGGVAEFYYSGGTDVGGLSYDGAYKLVYFGFGAEAIRNGEERWIDRNTVLARILNFFNYNWPSSAPTTTSLAVNVADAQHVIDHTPEISWFYSDESSLPQTHYQIQVTTVPDWSVLNTWDSGPISGTATFEVYSGNDLVDGESYYLRVRTSNGTLWSDWATISFHMNSVPIATVLFPSEAVEIDVNPPLLGHNKMTDIEGDALTYSYQLYAEVELTTLIEEIFSQAAGTGDTVFWQTTTILTEYEDYYWRTQSTDPYETGQWSEAARFIIVPAYVCGDANGDETVNVGDAVFIINYAFKGGPAPEPVESGDANGDGQSNVGDAVYIINYAFKGGPEPDCD